MSFYRLLSKKNFWAQAQAISLNSKTLSIAKLLWVTDFTLYLQPHRIARDLWAEIESKQLWYSKELIDNKNQLRCAKSIIIKIF